MGGTSAFCGDGRSYCGAGAGVGSEGLQGSAGRTGRRYREVGDEAARRIANGVGDDSASVKVDHEWHVWVKRMWAARWMGAAGRL